MGGVGSVLGLLAATLGILVLAWWASRWIALSGPAALTGPAALSGAGALSGGRGGERFHIVAQLALGRNERLVLVRLQERCLLLGVTDHAVTLLRELEGEEASEWMREAPTPPSFKDIFFKDILGKPLSHSRRRQT